ncbi:hypothetical protein ACFVHS_46050 [Streptomyces sp. NPDC057746]|uniref:hypothetical protein n=1 Tax=Streptomyces sp. NPDC057746 TaxID=3346237 RepID=UPI0036C517CA
MANDVGTLATALYATTDDMLKEHPDLAPWRPPVGITPRLSDAELVTLAMMQAMLDFTSEAKWLTDAVVTTIELLCFGHFWAAVHAIHAAPLRRPPHRPNRAHGDAEGLRGHRRSSCPARPVAVSRPAAKDSAIAPTGHSWPRSVPSGLSHSLFRPPRA